MPRRLRAISTVAAATGIVLASRYVIAADRTSTPRLPADTLPAVLPIDDVPLGLPRQRPVPSDNPLTAAKVRLGRRLFFDPILSADETLSCAGCHDPKRAFSDGRRTSLGVANRGGRRNAPSLFNVAYGRTFFWDGRADSLESQALAPIDSPRELAAGVPEVLRRLRGDRSYREPFEAVFPDGVTKTNLARVLASFERTLLLADSPVDRFRAGDTAALSPAQRQGLWLFESRGGCWRCHGGPNFADGAFHNTGVGWGSGAGDVGRFEVTRREADRGRFKTPSLRGVAMTAPYMHDGSLASLEEVVAFYSRGGNANPHLDAAVAPLDLSPQDIVNLVAFLRALSTEPDGDE